MSRLYNRMKGAIQRNIYSQRYYNPESYGGGEEDEEADYPERLDGNEPTNTNNTQRRENTPPRTQARGRAPINESPPTPPPTPVNPQNPEVRPVSDTIQPTTNVNPPVTTNIVPTPMPPAPTDLPNPTQPLLPPVNRDPQSSVRANLPSLRNRRRQPFIINSNSQLVGFPRSQNFLPASFNPRPSFPVRTPALTPRPPRTNISNLEIDYPIENVVINEDIPHSMLMKINEAVEHDRFGNAHHSRHYAYKPKTQYISAGNNRRLECRLVDDDHQQQQQMGVRYIREINYSQRQNNLNNFQIIIDNTPSQLNCFPTPIHHFTAHALPNDPMRYY